MATLIYTSESKTFKYEDTNKVQQGQKIISNSDFIRVDGGNIQIDGNFAATYSYLVENGSMKNLSVNFQDPTQAAVILSEISNCFTTLLAQD